MDGQKRLLNVLILCALAVIGVLSITHLGSINIGTHWSSRRRHGDNRTETPARPTCGELARAPPSLKMTLVFTICEHHFPIGLVAIKSAVAYSTTALHLVVIADYKNRGKMEKEYISWPATIRKRVTCEVRPLWFPKEDYKKWLRLFRQCASQRLFLPSMLPNVDAVLYVDTDAVFIHPVEDFWGMFYAMNEWQMAGMAPGTEHSSNWYLRKAGHPFVKPFALQSGLLLMNLTRMRRFGLEDHVSKLRREFEGRIRYGDQDLLNVLFTRYQQGIFTFTCRWNFRAEHCEGPAVCTDGPPAVIHGSRAQVLRKFEPAFVALHKEMLKYKLGDSLVEHFILPLNKSLGKANVTGCTKEFQNQMHEWRLSASLVDNATARSTSRRMP